MASNSTMAPGLAVDCVLTTLNLSCSPSAACACACAAPELCPLLSPLNKELARMADLREDWLISARRVRASMMAW